MTQPHSFPNTYPWRPDLGDGTYQNPIIFADYSDPDAVRVGDDFYMTASSFNSTPGLPVLHSTDLVNWELIGHALKEVPDARYAQVQSGCGVWAPAIRHHAGKFWIFFPTPDEGIYVITAIDARGPWSEPHLLAAGKGLIDPCPLWDDDGRAYLIFAYAGSRAGIKHRLDIREMDAAATHLTGSPTTIFNDPQNHPTAEGPKFYKRDGWYYVFAPAGGVATGWQLVLRSRNVMGPYEHRIVLAQGNTPVNGPHQGALLDTPTGEDWFIHFQELQPWGRILHLQPVKWTDGWPLIGEPSATAGVGQPVLRYRKPNLPTTKTCIPATSDSFDAPTLGLQWQWHANHKEDWASLSARPGWLRLAAMPLHPTDLMLTSHLLLQKFPSPAFQVETRVNITQPDSAGGIAVIGYSSAVLLRHRNEITLRVGNETVFRSTFSADTTDLRISVASDGGCQFAFRTESTWQLIDHPFTAREGMWIGAKIGLVAVSDQPGRFAEFNHFQFSAKE